MSVMIGDVGWFEALGVAFGLFVTLGSCGYLVELSFQSDCFVNDGRAINRFAGACPHARRTSHSTLLTDDAEKHPRPDRDIGPPGKGSNRRVSRGKAQSSKAPGTNKAPARTYTKRRQLNWRWRRSLWLPVDPRVTPPGFPQALAFPFPWTLNGPGKGEPPLGGWGPLSRGSGGSGCFPAVEWWNGRWVGPCRPCWRLRPVRIRCGGGNLPVPASREDVFPAIRRIVLCLCLCSCTESEFRLLIASRL